MTRTWQQVLEKAGASGVAGKTALYIRYIDANARLFFLLKRAQGLSLLKQLKTLQFFGSPLTVGKGVEEHADSLVNLLDVSVSFATYYTFERLGLLILNHEHFMK